MHAFRPTVLISQAHSVVVFIALIFVLKRWPNIRLVLIFFFTIPPFAGYLALALVPDRTSIWAKYGTLYPGPLFAVSLFLVWSLIPSNIAGEYPADSLRRWRRTLKFVVRSNQKIDGLRHHTHRLLRRERRWSAGVPTAGCTTLHARPFHVCDVLWSLFTHRDRLAPILRVGECKAGSILQDAEVVLGLGRGATPGCRWRRGGPDGLAECPISVPSIVW